MWRQNAMKTEMKEKTINQNSKKRRSSNKKNERKKEKLEMKKGEKGK